MMSLILSKVKRRDYLSVNFKIILLNLKIALMSALRRNKKHWHILHPLFSEILYEDGLLSLFDQRSLSVRGLIRKKDGK